MENKRNGGSISAGVRELYEGKVAIEAVTRVGRNKNLHGIVHEVLYKDVLTVNPSNFLNGTKAVLTRSTTAVRDDVLLMNSAKIAGRRQLKDTVHSIDYTVKQVASGQYKGTRLMGTKETVKAYNNVVEKANLNGANITQKMYSTGISSNDTTRIASKALGINPTRKILANTAKSYAVMGAVIGGGIEIVIAGRDLVNDQINVGQFFGRVTKEATGGGMSASAAGVAATVSTTLTSGILAGSTAPLWVPPLIGVGTALVVGSAVKSWWDSLWN